MIDLHGSRWATSRIPPPRIPLNSAASLKERQIMIRRAELDRFSKLLRRLNWRAEHLLFSESQVLKHRGSSSATEAETMFRIDFFEFYVLLERALVHLLASFAIKVSALSYQQPDDLDGNKSNGAIIGDPGLFGHSFHANVLQALDQSTNPVHQILGTGDVRLYIGIAKEFRNRWKDAEERPPSPTSSSRNLGALRQYEHLLNDLKLDLMLSSILFALQRAGEHAKNAVVAEGSQVESSNNIEVKPDDMPWEAMPDAMDLD